MLQTQSSCASLVYKHHPVQKVASERNVRLTRSNILQTSNHFTMSTGNLGGRQLMYHLTESHKKNLSNPKKRIDNSLPWSHREDLSSKLQKQLSPVRERGNNRNSKFSGGGKNNSSKSESRTESSSFSQKLHPIHHLVDGKHHEAYRGFVQLLSELGTDASYFIAQAACIDAEENLLLQDYCGIDPFFDDLIVDEVESEDMSTLIDDMDDEDDGEEGYGYLDYHENLIGQDTARVLQNERPVDKQTLEYSSAAITEMMFTDSVPSANHASSNI